MPRPLCQAHLLHGERLVQRGTGAQHLEQDHAEGVHVRLVRELPTPEVLGIEIPEAPLDRRANVGVLWGRAGLRQPEVRNLGDPVPVQKNVGGLDVAVDDAVLRSGVEVVQPPCGSDTYLQPLLPRQRRLLGLVQVIAEGPVSHVVVNQDHFPVLFAVADERDQVAVAELRQHLDFGLELPDSLPRQGVPSLDRHSRRSAVEVPAEDVSEPPNAEEQGLVETVGGRFDLGEREVAA
ncbi:uncharacterized protein M6B38_335115 [Iris pallida]|uniref:Uncharacterized protein n=1 Tax=Iris pallida TaxID=29817 RepID=A0AAX6GAK5_IRIPA|nr:uncharacterized protein M6B38_377770 [Iris pallida]KAJ6834402.1 uncharacterized protein M6B38_335115 [Iris pallida]